MNLLSRLEDIKKEIQELKDLNQKSFVREKDYKIKSINWSIKNAKEMFNILQSLSEEVRYSIEDLKHIY